MRVIPIAGHDSMLLNLSGAHGPFFTRNLVIIGDSAGNTGVGEVPGGEPIRRTLDDARALITGRSIGDHHAVLADMRRKFADRDAGGRGAQTFDLRVMVHAVTAVESALLDLLGQYLEVPVRRCSATDSSGTGCRRWAICSSSVTGPGPTWPTVGLRRGPDADDWLRIRHDEALSPDSVVRLAEAARERYGFRDFKLKGGVLPAPDEAGRSSLWPTGSPMHESRWTRTAAGCSPMRSGHAANCGRAGLRGGSRRSGGGFSGREVMAEFKRATGLRTATNMIATDWRELATPSGAAPSTSAGRSALLDDERLGARRPTVRRMGLTWGSHSNNHFDVSLAMFTHVAAAAPARSPRSTPIGSGRTVSASRSNRTRSSTVTSTFRMRLASASRSTRTRWPPPTSCTCRGPRRARRCRRHAVPDSRLDLRR
jgi:glucarate dehydratase